MEYRIEQDSMGEVKVPAEKYWGAQTRRSRENFPIGVGIETMPWEITCAFGILKQASARANHALKPDGTVTEFTCSVGALTDPERRIIADGCLINYYRNNKETPFSSFGSPADSSNGLPLFMS